MSKKEREICEFEMDLKNFLKTDIFVFRFQKNTRPHSVLESFSPIHTKTLNNGNTIASLAEDTSCQQ